MIRNSFASAFAKYLLSDFFTSNKTFSFLINDRSFQTFEFAAVINKRIVKYFHRILHNKIIYYKDRFQFILFGARSTSGIVKKILKLPKGVTTARKSKKDRKYNGQRQKEKQ